MSYLFILFYFLPILQLCSAELDTEWESFKIKYNKVYQNPEEEAFRKIIFANSLKYIQEHNDKQRSGFLSSEVGINEFADLSDEEFEAKFLNLELENDNDLFLMNLTETPTINTYNAPASKNWIEDGFKNPVLNQGGCGSCYVFGSIAAIEAQYFIKNKKLIQLSHQEIVDCSKPFGNHGCGGGGIYRTFAYAIKAGIGFDADNPYLEDEGICRLTKPRIKIKEFHKIQRGNETALKEIVGTLGPVGFGFFARNQPFRHYKSGIHYDPECSTTKLTHVMAIVGYGTENNQDYWLVRNSWSPDWGDNGHIKIARNRDNNCGVATYCYYPIL